MSLIELLVVVCEAIVYRMGSGYGVRKLRPVLLGSISCTSRIQGPPGQLHGQQKPGAAGAQHSQCGHMRSGGDGAINLRPPPISIET
ncbi:hypothetical protein YC2023_067009 [Brassica napus]